MAAAWSTMRLSSTAGLSFACPGSTAAHTRGALAHDVRFGKQERYGTGTDQLPIGVRQECALAERMMMRVLDDETSSRPSRTIDQRGVQRIGAFDFGRNIQAPLAHWPRKFFEHRLDVHDQWLIRVPACMRCDSQLARCLGLADIQLQACVQPAREQRTFPTAGCSSAVGSTMTRMLLIGFMSPALSIT